MKILLTGSDGQLGQEIIKTKPPGIELISTNKNEFNLANIGNINSQLLKIDPNFIINCGAFTNVDQAEVNRKIVMDINSLSVKEISKFLLKKGGNLLQISTDFVFNGSQSKAYKVDDKLSPINHYGFSKAKAEEYMHKILGPTNQGIIIRTSWLMGTISNNFLLTMLKLHKEKEIINVVSDQISCPTSTRTLSQACWKAILLKNQIKSNNKNKVPILHWCDNGVASWYDVAYSIGEIAKELNIINIPAEVNPIKSEEYNRKAKRPNFSLLDCVSTRKYLKLEGIYWRESLKESLNILVKNSKNL